jgi:hypothetical protein
VSIRWAPNRVITGAYYCTRVEPGECPNDFEVQLSASDELSKMTVAHELGHFIMHYTYNGMPPYGLTCRPHFMHRASGSAACAWSEGWANWVAVQTYDDTHFRWDAYSGIDLESPRWFSEGWENGDHVEGRVAGVLLDLADSGARNEKYWDIAAIGPERVVAAFTKGPADDIHQFVAKLGAADQIVAEGILFQNTIRATHTDFLHDRSPLRRPANVPLETEFLSVADRWHVVAAIASGEGDADVDLNVLPDAAGQPAVTSADWSGSNADFVAVQPTTADEWFKAGVTSDVDYHEYAMEVAEAPDGDLEAGTPQELAMAADSMVEIRTTFVQQGVPATLTVVPRNGQDFDLFVMAPDATKWGLPRSSARRSTSGGPNKAERITITDPKVTGVYAVIVIRKSGEGGLTLVRT